MELRLIKTGKHKIELIKLIKLFTNLGLREAKELADVVPSVFTVNGDKYNFEQIQKNFAGIGAVIEKIEPVKEPVSNIPGEDIQETKPIQEKTSKFDYKKEEQKSSTIANEKNIKNYTDKNFFSLDKKAENVFFVKSIKSSIYIAVIGSLLYSIISYYYYSVSSILVFLIIGVVIAINIRSVNGRSSRNLGILAAAFTLFSYFTNPFFSKIIYLFLFGDLFIMRGYSIFSNIMSIFYPSAFIPAIIAFLIASNAHIGEKLSSILKSDNKSSFNSKSIKKGKRSIKRKKRKLD